MDRDLYTEDHHAFRDVVREFVIREVAPNLDRWDREHLIGRDTWLAAGRHPGIVLDRTRLTVGAPYR